MNGNNGATGAPGPAGANGIPGQNGPTGQVGDKGDNGVTGIPGDKGAKGDAGYSGRKVCRALFQKGNCLVGFFPWFLVESSPFSSALDLRRIIDTIDFSILRF